MKINLAKSGSATGKGMVRLSFTKDASSRFEVTEKGEDTLLFPKSEKPHTLRTLRIAVRKIVEESRRHGITSLGISHPEALAHGLSISDEVLGELFAYNLIVAGYTFTKYKKPSSRELTSVTFTDVSPAFKSGVLRGVAIGESATITREIANTPASDMTPALLASAALRALKGTRAKVTVLGEKEIARFKMGAILGVSKGSPEKPRFIIIEYKGGAKKEKPLVFVGKGITFDTGGLSMKPGDAMLDMHLDMSGGAAVIGALYGIAKLGLKRTVIGLIPAAENSVSGTSYRPGDILTTMKGLTVDVLNTDAEGRLVLADALTYAERYEPELVVDVATLTGAALVALGQHASALMTKDDTIASKLAAYGEETGDYLWRLPLWDEYTKYTKGIHGDLANIQSSGNARYGGAINGGAFLSHFATKFPWAHIDMAPRMTPAPGDHLAKGATGEPTALLVRIAEKY
ncbi:MAG: hypothetical protein RLZZ234_324 [Candidatus Parcubacteria bacterium]|jgi:leucyl aminopeptidase